MEQVPPSTAGNRASSTRCPVSSGVSASSFCAVGRGERTGHSCFMQYFCRQTQSRHKQSLLVMVWLEVAADAMYNINRANQAIIKALTPYQLSCNITAVKQPTRG